MMWVSFFIIKSFHSTLRQKTNPIIYEIDEEGSSAGRGSVKQCAKTMLLTCRDCLSRKSRERHQNGFTRDEFLFCWGVKY